MTIRDNAGHARDYRRLNSRPICRALYANAVPPSGFSTALSVTVFTPANKGKRKDRVVWFSLGIGTYNCSCKYVCLDRWIHTCAAKPRTRSGFANCRLRPREISSASEILIVQMVYRRIRFNSPPHGLFVLSIVFFANFPTVSWSLKLIM